MIDRISHIGIVVEDVEEAQKLWTEVFGLKKFEDISIDVEGIRSVFLSVSGTWDEMTIELMQPLDKSDMNNAVARRLAKSGEGFYHLAVEVADVERTGAVLGEHGLPVIERPAVSAEDAPRWLVHPKAANGVMVEGLEKRDGKA
jgi:methylmalonyl-CoA/ethylmalonyl-CoA epimerase